MTAARILLLLALLGSCGLVDRVVDADGTVYDCGVGAEYCYYADAADELGELTGRSCSATTIGDRWYPGLTNALGRGCVYSCKPHKGCNAKQGCYCEATP